MGRQSKRTPTIIEIALAYLQDSKQYGDVVPSVAGLAVTLDVSRETIYDWSNPKSDRYDKTISDTVAKILTHQERDLLNGSLDNKLNASISKLMLSANHNYREKQEVTGKDGGPVVFMPVELINKHGLDENK